MQLSLINLGHRFGAGTWLFRGITLILNPGQVYSLTGPSGSGKSTLLSLLAGWEKPVSGEIVRESIDRTAWVFQNPHGVPRRTAIDHVALPFLATGMDNAAAVAKSRELLKKFGLAEVAEQEFRSLSGGQAQRLMLARGIASAPSLLLVDEPTAQLDRVTAAEVNDALTGLASPETIIVIATHDENTRDACTNHIDLNDYQTNASSGAI